MKNELINNGPTFSGIAVWVSPIFIITGVMMFFNIATIIFAIPVLIGGVLLLLSLSGIEIDYENKKIRQYKNYLIFRFGDWYDFSDFDSITLMKVKESVALFGRTGEKIYRSNTYEVCLTGKRKLELGEFLKYKDGKKYMDKYAKKMGYNTIDKILNSIVAIEQKRAASTDKKYGSKNVK